MFFSFKDQQYNKHNQKQSKKHSWTKHKGLWGASVYDYSYLPEKNLTRAINTNMKKILDGYFYHFKVNFLLLYQNALHLYGVRKRFQIWRWKKICIATKSMKSSIMPHLISEIVNQVWYINTNVTFSTLYWLTLECYDLFVNLRH